MSRTGIVVKIQNSRDPDLAVVGMYANSLSVTDRLDAVGQLRVELPLTDRRALAIANEDLLLIEADGVARSMYARKQSVRETASGLTLIWEGPDQADELARVRVPRGTVYEVERMRDIINDLRLLPRDAGYSLWFQTNQTNDLMSVRFDGQTVLKCLRTLAKFKGMHFRSRNLSATERFIQVDKFLPADHLLDNVMVMQPGAPHAVLNPLALLVESVEVVTDTFDVINWMEPIGSGNGEAVLTLRDSTRTGPYTIQQVAGPRGPAYILRDEASIALYGEIQRTRPYRDVGPLSNESVLEREYAANALYDIAAADLEKLSQKLETYKVTVRPAHGVDTTDIKPGSSIRMVYKGTAKRRDGTVTYLDVNRDLYVMSVTRSVRLTGLSLSMELATVDRVEMDAAEIVVGALESIELRNVNVEPYLSHNTFTYEEEIGPSFSTTIPLYVTNITREITRVLLRLSTRPLRATVTGTAGGGGTATTTSAGGSAVVTSAGGGGTATTTAGGGDHNHRMFAEVVSSIPPTTTRKFAARNGDGPGSVPILFEFQAASSADIWTDSSSGSHSHSITIGQHTHGISLPAHSHSLTLNDHTHAMQYGIFDQSGIYPALLTVTVNGIAVPGGPWGGAAGPTELELDITEQIKASTLRQKHQIVVGCGAGQGIVQGNIDVSEIITSVDMGAV